jgi:class 3 adenylate cyclase/tetratricopeptide (TPR) repeat protein
MRCSSCNHDNPGDAAFCEGCGAKLELICPTCKASVSPGARFCKKCGTAIDLTKAAVSSPKAQIIVADDSVDSKAPSVPAPEVAGERRHLTILFCDLVGSTAIAAKLDPEEWRETVAGYHRAAADAITRFDGHVAKYLGDGVMAFFGYPEAHDNDAERAARAGLGIVDAIAKLNAQPAHAELSARIGIDSGRVVVGTGTGNAVDAFGEAANIAARVQAAAEPGTVMITDATQRLVSGLFIVEDRGAQALKGIERPVQLFRVVRSSGMRGRFQAVSAAGGLTPFVGREDELRSLMTRWERVLEGEGQVVTIIGEAGIGKSRLVQRFHEEIAGTPHTWIEAGAGAFFQNTPFYPISEMLRQMIGDTSASDLLKQLGSRLTAVRLKAAEAIPLLAPLLNLVVPPEYPALALSPEQQRRRLLATLVEWVLGSARSQPLVIATEDLHWVDPSTLELIQLLVEQGATARLMLLYTGRPEFRPPWPPRGHHVQVTLNRLSAGNVRTIVGEVAARKTLSDETITAVVERTGGVPLFVEELTRAVLESGDAKLLEREIPATLHDSLMARLDRLGPAKEVMQVGAVIGRDFSYELLHAVHPMAEDNLQRALRSLTDAELLYVRGIAPEATYQFKHALIRDAAYEALLKSRRKELHLMVARTIDQKFPLLRETHPEVLARHWTEVGDGAKAVQYLHLAGEQAATRAAHAEAISHFSEALDWLERLPPPIDETQRCALLLALGREQRRAGEPLKAQETFIRSAEIAETSGATESVVQAALDLARLTFTVGLSGDPAVRLLRGALERIGPEDSVLRANILGGLGIVLGLSGEQTQAIEYAEQGIAMSRRLGDPEALELTLQGANYAFQGPQYLERRLAVAKERLDLAKILHVKQGTPFEEQLTESQSELSQCLLELGDLVAADATFEAWARSNESIQMPFRNLLAAGRGATRALMRGDFELSEKLARQALEIGQRLQVENIAAGMFGLQMFALSRERGQLKGLEPVVRLFVEQNTAADTWRPGLAVIYSELGRTEEARAEFEHFASDDFEDLPRDAVWMGSMTYLADVCVFLGDKARASILYRLLLPFDGRNVVIGFAVVCYGALSRFLGALAATLERWDDAARHFEDALSMNARIEAWPWLAHTQYQYATMLLSRDLSGDRDRAFALLDSALAIAHRLGMRGLEERVTVVLHRPPLAARSSGPA